MQILEVKNLKKYYGEGNTLVRALDGIDLKVEKGEFVAIIGPSGSGKSTLLHILGAVDEPSSGKVFMDGKDVFKQNEEQLAIFRRRQVGLVYQFYNLIPVLNVYENIVLPIELDGGRPDGKFITEIVKTLCLRVNADACRFFTRKDVILPLLFHQMVRYSFNVYLLPD